jgi:hypothetical protein
MRETILKCDNCGEKVENLVEVGAGARQQSYSYNYGHLPITHQLYQHTAEWCNTCCIKWGILKPVDITTKSTVPEPTLEDFLREIIREEIEQGRQ